MNPTLRSLVRPVIHACVVPAAYCCGFAAAVLLGYGEPEEPRLPAQSMAELLIEYHSNHGHFPTDYSARRWFDVIWPTWHARFRQSMWPDAGRWSFVVEAGERPQEVLVQLRQPNSDPRTVVHARNGQVIPVPNVEPESPADEASWLPR